jgi:hypothetical protein
MKKIALMFAFLLFFAGTYAERVTKIHEVSGTSDKFPVVCQPGDLIINKLAATIYIVDSVVGTQETILTAVAGDKLTPVYALNLTPLAVASDIIPSIDTIYNLGSPTYQWLQIWVKYVIADYIVADTLATEGVRGALVPIRDSLYDLGSGSLYWRDLYLKGTELVNEIWIMGLIHCDNGMGKSAFNTTATRKAIYVSGIDSIHDVYSITPIATNGSTLPVAGDLCSYYIKTDSLIVMRAAGTTSGLAFSYIRINAND